MYLFGNDAPAKEAVMEMILPIWLRTCAALQNGNFAFRRLRQPEH